MDSTQRGGRGETKAVIVHGEVAAIDKLVNFKRRREWNITRHDEHRFVDSGCFGIGMPICSRRIVRQCVQKRRPDIIVQGLPLLQQYQGTRTTERRVWHRQELFEPCFVSHDKDACCTPRTFYSTEDIVQDRNSGIGRKALFSPNTGRLA